MQYLIDTNIISEIFKPKPIAQVTDWIAAQDLVGISTISIEETYYGLAYKKAYRQLAWFENFLQSRCEILPVTPEIARHCGNLRAQLRQQGITRSQSDLLIAATALNNQLTIVTRNVKDFQNINLEIFNPFND